MEPSLPAAVAAGIFEAWSSKVLRGNLLQGFPLTAAFLCFTSFSVSLQPPDTQGFYPNPNISKDPIPKEAHILSSRVA